MYIVHVDIHVKPEFLDAFVAASVENARNSLQERASPAPTSCGARTTQRILC
ncbi:MAG: hypothetical protein U0521_18785 [Anaerolineae bacterium]